MSAIDREALLNALHDCIDGDYLIDGGGDSIALSKAGAADVTRWAADALAAHMRTTDCSQACTVRQVLVTRLNDAIDARDQLQHGAGPCPRRLWGDPEGLPCSRRDPHIPGPSTCRYVGGSVDDDHTLLDEGVAS